MLQYMINKLFGLFRKKKSKQLPIIIINKKCKDIVKEYDSIDQAISDLENDPNVPADKIEKLKASLKQLKNKNLITIRNGEII